MAVRALVVLVPILAGCGTLPDGSAWGEKATLLPGWARVGRAAARAALEPATWAPAVAAGVFAIDHFDRRVSDWASDHHPIFGSESTAQDWSDYLNDIQLGGTIVTALVTPSGDEAGPWLLSKTKGLAVEAGGPLATAGVVQVLKVAVGRERPNGRGNSSFPSGHAGFAFALATDSSRNVESLSMPWPARIGAQAGFYTLAGLDGWARVEAHRHFPADVLASAAIGHFLTAFIHDSFLGLPEKGFPEIALGPSEGGAFVGLAWSF